MGNRTSSNVSASDSGYENIGNRVWLYIYRTWEGIVSSDRRTKSRTTSRSRKSDLSDITTEFDSQYSVCSCSQCQKDDGFSSGCYRALDTGTGPITGFLSHSLGLRKGKESLVPNENKGRYYDSE
ncbi:hypothetical protein WA026_001969 [Henosepilachna vigintioctopunctata]|uniref:Uncharacterized protein n=1 Tax=Henosepilachna vigintioctopunctata TaxID=420089 RepID=A0AAW1USF7_9CUCU